MTHKTAEANTVLFIALIEAALLALWVTGYGWAEAVFKGTLGTIDAFILAGLMLRQVALTLGHSMEPLPPHNSPFPVFSRVRFWMVLGALIALQAYWLVALEAAVRVAVAFARKGKGESV